MSTVWKPPGKQCFQNLNLAQMDILSANCLAHILHNASKYTTGKVDIDVENVVLNLTNFWKLISVMFCIMWQQDGCHYYHLLTGYWSTGNSFQGLGEEECPKVLWTCFKEVGNTSISVMCLTLTFSSSFMFETIHWLSWSSESQIVLHHLSLIRYGVIWMANLREDWRTIFWLCC